MRQVKLAALGEARTRNLGINLQVTDLYVLHADQLRHLSVWLCDVTGILPPIKVKLEAWLKLWPVQRVTPSRDPVRGKAEEDV